MNRTKVILAAACVTAAIAAIIYQHSGKDAGLTSAPAAEQGVSSSARPLQRPAAAEDAADHKRLRSREPEQKTAAAKAMADQFIRQATASDEDRTGMSLELMEELARFDSPQLQSVISLVNTSSALDQTAKAEATGFLLPVLARIDPMTALDLRLNLQLLFQDHEDILPISKLLETVAAADPAVASEWEEKHPPSGH